MQHLEGSVCLDICGKSGGCTECSVMMTETGKFVPLCVYTCVCVCVCVCVLGVGFLLDLTSQTVGGILQEGGTWKENTETIFHLSSSWSVSYHLTLRPSVDY